MQSSLGIIGAALVTGIALLLGQGFVMNWYYSKKIGLQIKRFWKEILKVYFIPGAMCIVFIIISFFVDFYFIPAFLIGVLIYSLVFVVLSWCMTFNKYEKDLFRIPVSKVVNRLKDRRRIQ